MSQKVIDSSMKTDEVMRPSPRNQFIWTLLVAVSLTTMSGCGPSATEELSTWIDEERKQQRVKLDPISPPKRFVPQKFEGGEVADPYGSQRLAAALRRESRPAGDGSALAKPEIARQLIKKQPLESPPLDAISYVGSLTREGRPIGLVRVNGLIYQVNIGDYLGQNFGKILTITDSDISLREIFQDTEGEWSERSAILQLQRGSK